MTTKLPPVYRTGLSTPGLHGAESQCGILVPYQDKAGVTSDGPSYSIKSSPVKFKLPQPKTLRPYVDSKAGVLDTWPAHTGGLGQAPPLAIATKGAAPKPKFLEQLEGFLQRELRALDCNDPNVPSERRLQAFREVFECLIDDFKTYRPILSAIKNEYELMIVSQRQKIRELEPFQSSLVTISEQCEQKIVSLKQEEKGEVMELKKENGMLRDMILKMRAEQHALNEQVRKLQVDIAEEYKKYRDECDARKLLVQDLNDLKFQQDEARRTSLSAADEEDDSSGNEDGTLLRIALRKAREDLEAKTMKLAEVLADYGDVVPRRDFEKLESDFKNVENELSELKVDYDSLLKDNSALIEVHKKVVEQRDHYSADCEQLRRSGTPRPTWSKCAKYVEGGAERWELISQDKTSDELVDVLLSEMTGQDIALIQSGAGNEAEYFEGLGVGTDIPSLFRWEGKIHNRRFSRRDTLLLIRDIWNARSAKLRASTQEDEERDSFQDFVDDYFRNRFGTKELSVEWAYNLHDACQRYNHDVKIGTFNEIYNGQCDEAIHHDNVATLEGLFNALVTADESEKGMVSKDKFKEVLIKYFPSKDEESIHALMTTAEAETGPLDEGVAYSVLLTESEDGQQGMFASKVLEQRTREKLSYIRQIEERLQGKESVTLEEAREALLIVDPGLDETTCFKFLSRGFGLARNKLKPATKIDLHSLVENLKTGSINRVST